MPKSLWSQTIVAALLAAWLGLGAPPPAGAGEGEQVALTPGLVQAMMAASEEMFKSREQEAGEGEDEAGAAGRDSEPQELSAAAEAALDTLVRKHGFAGIAEFERVSGSVMSALQAIELESPETIAQIKAEIARLQADASIPAAEKDEMLGSLRQQLTPPAIAIPANLDVVRPFRDKLLDLLEGGQPE